MKSTYWTAALLGLAGLVSALSPVETYGPLSIKSAQMVDSTGKPVTLRGMSLFWHYDMGGKEFYLSSPLKWVMTDWHASVIRAPIGVEDRALAGREPIGGAISNPTYANSQLEIVINAAIDYGFYVVVDWHAHQEHTTEAKAWFSTLAQKYGNTPNIIWEIFNEPTGGISSNYAKTVVAEIRKYSKNVILVGSSPWAQNPQDWGSDLDGYPNIAYTIHFYSDHNFWGNVTSAMGKGHAVFASEWGMSGSSGNGGFQSTSTGNIKSWLDVLEQKGVSSCNWFIGNAAPEGGGTDPQTSASLKAKVSFTGGWDPATDLSESGIAIRNWLRSKNPAWTVNDTALKVVSPFAITSTKKTDLVIKQDTIRFAATFSKDVSWSIKHTGRTSKATYGAQTGKTKSVNVWNLAGTKDLIGSAFQPGEVVDVILEPKTQKLSYTLSTATGIVKRVHETELRWVGTRLFAPSGLLAEGSQVQVSLRDASGRSVFQTSAIVDGFGRIELGLRPRSESLQILDITSSDAVIRSRLAPNF